MNLKTGLLTMGFLEMAVECCLHSIYPKHTLVLFDASLAVKWSDEDEMELMGKIQNCNY